MAHVTETIGGRKWKVDAVEAYSCFHFLFSILRYYVPNIVGEDVYLLKHQWCVNTYRVRLTYSEAKEGEKRKPHIFSLLLGR